MNNDEKNLSTTYRRSQPQNSASAKSKYLQQRLDKAILLVVILIVFTYLILFFV